MNALASLRNWTLPEHLPTQLVVPVCVFAAVLLAFLPAESTAQSKYEWTEPHMGVPFTIAIFADDKARAEAAAAKAFARVEELNSILSDYQADSELRQLSAGAPHQDPVGVSNELLEVLAQAESISKASDGAFDISVGAVTRLWRIARRTRRLPSDESLHQALEATDYQAIELQSEPPGVRLTKRNMRLDAGGIGKGYAADEAMRILREEGFPVSLVDASGDIVLGDAPPDKLGWSVGVAPLEANGKPSRQLLLHNCAIATSGDAFQYVEIEGVRYSHIVDPKTGLGLTTRSSVTIYAPTGTQADAWASAVSVLGHDRGIETVNQQQGIEAFIVFAAEDSNQTEGETLEIKTVASNGFPEEASDAPSN